MTLDPSRDAAAFLRFAIDPDPDAIGDVLARYDDADDLRSLLTAISVVLSAVVPTPGSEIRARLQERLDAIALLFMAGASNTEDGEP